MITTTRVILAALIAGAAWKITTAGTTWPPGNTQLLPASWAAAAVILTIGPVVAYALITAAGGNWRPRT